MFVRYLTAICQIAINFVLNCTIKLSIIAYNQMRMNINPRILLLFLAFSLCFISPTQAGGPWPAGKGGGFLQLSNTFIRYQELLMYKLGNTPLRRSVLDNTIQVYAEYGLTDKFTAQLVLPYKVTATGDMLYETTYPNYDTLLSGRLNGFSNISFAGKYTFFDDGFMMAGQLKTEARTFSYDNLTGLRTGYGTWAFVPSILFGGGFGKGYAYGETGMAVRTHGYSEEIRSNLEVGYSPFKNFWTAIVLDTRRSLRNGEYIDGNGHHTALYVNDQEFDAWGLKFSYQLENKLGLSAAFYGAFGGRYVAAFPTLNVGVFYQWSGEKKN